MAEILEEIMETAEDTQKGKFLTFSVGKESYGIEIKFVKRKFNVTVGAGFKPAREFMGGFETRPYIYSFNNNATRLAAFTTVSISLPLKMRADSLCTVSTPMN